MNLVKLLEAARLALADDVLPEIISDHARSQLAGVLDILSKFERTVTWSTDNLLERQKIIEAGLAAITECANRAGYPPPPPPLLAATVSPLSRQSDFEQAVNRAEQQLSGMADWLFGSGTALPSDLRNEVDAILRQTLRDDLIVERRLISRGARLSI